MAPVWTFLQLSNRRNLLMAGAQAGHTMIHLSTSCYA